MAFRFDYTRKEVLGRPVQEKRNGEALTTKYYSEGVPLRFAMQVFDQPTGVQGDFGRYVEEPHGRRNTEKFVTASLNGAMPFGDVQVGPPTSSNSSNIG